MASLGVAPPGKDRLVASPETGPPPPATRAGRALTLTRAGFLRSTLGAVVPLVTGGPARPWPTERSVRCPIYFFHDLAGPSVLTRLLDGLDAQGLQPIGANDLLTFFEEGRVGWERPPCIISFDDGFLSQSRIGVPILEARAIPAVFCLMAHWRGDGDPRHVYMTDDEIVRAIAPNPRFEIFSHTLNHPPDLPELHERNLGAWQAEIVQSKQALADLTGREIAGFAYPYGRFAFQRRGIYHAETLDLVAGTYRLALSTRWRDGVQWSGERWLLQREQCT